MKSSHGTCHMPKVTIQTRGGTEGWMESERGRGDGNEWRKACPKGFKRKRVRERQNLI